MVCASSLSIAFSRMLKMRSRHDIGRSSSSSQSLRALRAGFTEKQRTWPCTRVSIAGATFSVGIFREPMSCIGLGVADIAMRLSDPPGDTVPLLLKLRMCRGSAPNEAWQRGLKNGRFSDWARRKRSRALDGTGAAVVLSDDMAREYVAIAFVYAVFFECGYFCGLCDKELPRLRSIHVGEANGTRGRLRFPSRSVGQSVPASASGSARKIKDEEKKKKRLLVRSCNLSPWVTKPDKAKIGRLLLDFCRRSLQANHKNTNSSFFFWR